MLGPNFSEPIKVSAARLHGFSVGGGLALYSQASRKVGTFGPHAAYSPLMKRSAVLLLTSLTLLSGLADAARRSGGGFGGSRSSGSYRSSPSYRAPSTPRYTPPRNIPPRTSGNTYTTPRTPAPSTPKVSLPSTASIRNSPLNTAAAAKVTPTQLSNWNKTSLPAGVPRSALTYSATPSSQYQYQLQSGRYFPYPQSYYRQNNLGYDILKYALIFTAVGSVADAMTPDVVSPNNAAPMPQNADQSNVDQSNTVQPNTAQPSSGPNLWTYAGVGFMAAAAAWFMMGRRR